MYKILKVKKCGCCNVEFPDLQTVKYFVYKRRSHQLCSGCEDELNSVLEHYMDSLNKDESITFDMLCYICRNISKKRRGFPYDPAFTGETDITVGGQIVTSTATSTATSTQGSQT